MTNQTIPPCPVCGTVPKYSSTVVDYRGSITCILLVPLCTCLIDARRIGGEISTNQWDQLCSEYLGRACRELGIETAEQLKAKVQPDPRVAVLEAAILQVIAMDFDNNSPWKIKRTLEMALVKSSKLIAAQRGEG